jgi:hypothetical protein
MPVAGGIKGRSVDPSPKDNYISHADVPSGPVLHFVTIMKPTPYVHPLITNA